MGVIVLYHRHCMDGKGAAAVVAHKHPGARFFPMQYGDEIPLPLDKLRGSKVYIVDYSMKVDQMREVKEAVGELGSVLWFDHHKTALETQKELGWGDVVMEESGATLTWKLLFPGEEMPQILRYIRDRDLWLWELGFSREVSESLRVRYPADDFKELLDLDPRDLIAEGKKFWDSKMRQVDRNCQRAYAVSFHGKRGAAVNAYEHVSETGERLLNTTRAEVAIMYWREAGKWIYSLRSKALTDVSELAKIHDGGGHAQSAGFQGLWEPGEVMSVDNADLWEKNGSN